MATANLNAQTLRELLYYDHQSGVFRWKITRGRSPAGSIAGNADAKFSYVRIRINGKTYLAHRLAVLYHTGNWPSGCVDHIDGVKTNNAITNLRDVSLQTNTQNQRNPASDNKTGFLGVSFHKKRQEFRAVITVNRRQVWIGAFDTAEGAHAAYIEAKRKLHRGCTL